MPLLFHRRDVTSDAAEGLCSRCGAKATTDLLLDFHHPQIPLGQIVVKGHRKVFHKGQRFGLVLRQPVQQILAFVLFLAPTLTTGWRRVVVLFFQASLQESAVALLVVSELGGGQCRLAETWPRHPLHQCGNNRILSRGGALRPFWQKVAKTVGSWFF